MHYQLLKSPEEISVSADCNEFVICGFCVGLLIPHPHYAG